VRGLPPSARSQLDNGRRSQDYRVLRFWNDQVLKETSAVLEEVLRMLSSAETSGLPLTPALSPSMKPMGGEGDNPSSLSPCGFLHGERAGVRGLPPSARSQLDNGRR